VASRSAISQPRRRMIGIAVPQSFPES